jgi:hypothetical protein
MYLIAAPAALRRAIAFVPRGAAINRALLAGLGHGICATYGVTPMSRGNTHFSHYHPLSGTVN